MLDYKCYPESNILHTLFSEVEVYLNETKISPSASNYSYRAFFENLLSHSTDEKKSRLVCDGFYTENDRSAVIIKYSKMKKKTLECYGRLHADIFHQPRLLLSGCDLKLRLLRNTPGFCIKKDSSITDGDKLTPSIEDIYMNIRRVKLTPHQHMEIERTLNNSAAKYPITRVDVKLFTVNSGVSSLFLNNIVNGKLPTRILYGLTRHTSYNGKHEESGFIFSHHNLKSTGVYINGTQYNQNLEADYNDISEEQSLHIRPYHSLFSELSNSGDLIDVTYNDFKSHYCIYAFDLTQDRCVSPVDHVNPSRQGELSIHLEFSRPISDNLTLITYLEYSSLIQLDKARQAYTDF